MTKHDRIAQMVSAAGGDVAGWQAWHREDLIAGQELVQFLPFVRSPSIPERFGYEPEREHHGVTVYDQQGGVQYDIVLDERGRPTYFAVRAIGGTLNGVDEWPREHVALLARQFLRSGESEQQMSRTTAQQVDTFGGRPRHEYIADLIREAHAAGVSPRVAIHKRLRKPLPTVDRWLREARAADPTLPQATRDPRKNRPEGSE